MDRRNFLKAGLALAAAPVAALAGPPPTPAEDGTMILSSDYSPDRWSLSLTQPVTHLGERDAMGQAALGHHLVTELSRFPNDPAVFEMRPWKAKPDGGWWESVPDPAEPPRYYLVGPARLVVKHDDVVVADSGEGNHYSGEFPFEALLEWSKTGTGQPVDREKMAPLGGLIGPHVTDLGFWHLFEIFKADPLADLVLCWLSANPKKGPRWPLL